MSKLPELLKSGKKLLSVYFTAGFPKLGDTVHIIRELERSGVDFIEIGLPFSDPLADGPTIQNSSAAAIENGMSAKLLFAQLENIRQTVRIPLVIMGYFNTMLQFGLENFLAKCRETGIDGLIVPDLPLEIYASDYTHVFEKFEIPMIFLITPQTPDQRIRQIDAHSSAFIYLVSSASVTGNASDFGHAQRDYFERISAMKLSHPTIAGFGIHDKATFDAATEFTSGAIVGSAFINHLSKHGTGAVEAFVNRFHEND